MSASADGQNQQKFMRIKMDNNHLVLVAESFFLKKEYPKALEVYSELLDNEKQNLEYIIKIALCHYNMGMFDKILNYLKMLYPKSVEEEMRCDNAYRLLLDIADICREKFEYNEAINYYSEYAKLTNEIDHIEYAAEKLYETGEICFKNIKYDIAIEAYKKSIEIIPNYQIQLVLLINCMLGIGNSCYELKQYENCVDYYLKYLDEMKRNEYSYDESIIKKSIDAGKAEIVIESKILIFQKIISFFEPEFIPSIESEAEPETEEYHMIKKYYIQVLQYIGQVYCNSEYFDEAEKYYLKLLKIYFKQRDFDLIFKKLYEIINKYINNNEYNKARSLYEKMQNIVRFDEYYEGIVKRILEIGEREKEEIITKNQIEKSEAKIKERNRLLQNFSHNIKNAIIRVRSPLENLREEYKRKNELFPINVQNAIKHIEKIEKVAKSINFSFTGNIEDFKYDATNCEKGKNFKQIVMESLETSIENLLDQSGIYSNFSKNYFTLIEKKNIRQEYYNMYKIIEYNQLISFINEYFLNLSIRLGESEKYIIGDKYHSLTKISILFDELIFNAMKYASLIEKNIRFIKLEIYSDDYIKIKLENSFNPYNLNEKTTGIGNEIIKNMVDILGGQYSVDRADNDNVYRIIITFLNIWRNI